MSGTSGSGTSHISRNARVSENFPCGSRGGSEASFEILLQPIHHFSMLMTGSTCPELELARVYLTLESLLVAFSPPSEGNGLCWIYSRCTREWSQSSWLRMRKSWSTSFTTSPIFVEAWEVAQSESFFEFF